VDDKLYVTARGDNRLIVVDAPGGAQ
jgi:hypothetical protein